MANDSKAKRKKRFEKLAFASFLLSVCAAGWFVMALLGDLMNSRLLFIPFVSLLFPLAFSLLMYIGCKCAQEKADAIVTELEEEEERRRQDRIAAALRVYDVTKNPRLNGSNPILSNAPSQGPRHSFHRNNDVLPPDFT